MLKKSSVFIAFIFAFLITKNSLCDFASPFVPHTVYALGDLHGDFWYTLASLYTVGVIDSSGHWNSSAQSTMLIQIGDILDRGPDGRLLFDYFELLAAEAATHHSQVVQLLGNHEVMNLMNYLHYVSEEEFACFGGREVRAAAFEKDGKYGKLVREFPMMVIVNETVFVHGGLLPEWAALGSAEINERSHTAMMKGKWKANIFLGDGPLWTRDLKYYAERGDCRVLEESLLKLSKKEGREVTRMVVGHTPTLNRMRSFCKGSLVVIDIAISRAMGGGNIGVLQLYYNSTDSKVVASRQPHWSLYTDGKGVQSISDVINQMEHKLKEYFFLQWMQSPYVPLASCPNPIQNA